MLLLRNLLYWFLMVVFSLCFLPVVMLSRLIPGGVNKTCTFWALTLVWLLKHIIGLHYRIVGAERIPDRPSVIFCKHQSGWETLALPLFFPLQVFVAKRELFKIPVFGWCLKWAGTIGIDRGSPVRAAQQMFEQGKKCRDRGLWITVFPEGTRIPPGFRGRYKHGAARLAKELHVDLVPVALNSGEFWPKNSFFKYPGMITVSVAAPVSCDTVASAEELTRLCENLVEDMQAQIQGAGPFACRHPQIPTPRYEGKITVK